MPNYSNPIADTSIEVLRVPIPVQIADLSGNSFTLSGGGIPVTPTAGLSLVNSANTAIPAAQPAIVQKAKAVSTSGVASLTCAFTSNNTAGNSIVVSCAAGNNGTITVTDSAGNTYTSAVSVANSTTFESQIFYAVNIAAGANTITVTPSASVSVAVQIYEVSGLIAQATNVLGQNTSNAATSATASASNIAGPANSIAFAAVAVGTAAQAVSATSGTIWSLDSTQNVAGTPSGFFTFGALSGVVTNIAPFAAKATLAGSEPYAYVAAVFKTVNLTVQGGVYIDGYNYTNMTTQTTTLIKTGPGLLHAVAVNKPVATGTIELDDALTHTNPFGIITIPATATNPFTMIYDVTFSTGLSVTTGTATQDITLIWR